MMSHQQMIYEHAPTIAYFEVHVFGALILVSAYFETGTTMQTMRMATSAYSWNEHKDCAICVKDRYTGIEDQTPIERRFFNTLVHHADVRYMEGMKYNQQDIDQIAVILYYQALDCGQLPTTTTDTVSIRMEDL